MSLVSKRHLILYGCFSLLTELNIQGFVLNNQTLTTSGQIT